MKKKKETKIGPSGGWGARYGRKSRKIVKELDVARKKGGFTCPKCGSPSVKKESFGVWFCRKCGTEFTGGAYVPVTPVGRAATKSVQTGESEEFEEKQPEEGES